MMCIELRSIVLMSISFLLLSVAAGYGSDKTEDVRAALHIVEKIESLAAEGAEKADASVREILFGYIEPLTSTQQLEKCAILCWSIAIPQNAGDESIDRYFDSAYWVCVERLAIIPGRASAKALEDILRVTNPDAGDRLTLQNFILHQRKLRQ